MSASSGRAEIPVERLTDGVDLALKSARRLALAARVAADADDAHTAAVLLYQAAEEVGKAKFLAEASGNSTAVAVAAVQGPRSHENKFTLATHLIPADCLELWGPAFDPQVFDPAAFQTEPIRIDWSRRQASLYANWDEALGTWASPPEPERLVVGRSAARMADFIDSLLSNGMPD